MCNRVVRKAGLMVTTPSGLTGATLVPVGLAMRTLAGVAATRLAGSRMILEMVRRPCQRTVSVGVRSAALASQGRRCSPVEQIGLPKIGRFCQDELAVTVNCDLVAGVSRSRSDCSGGPAVGTTVRLVVSRAAVGVENNR